MPGPLTSIGVGVVRGLSRLAGEAIGTAASSFARATSPTPTSGVGPKLIPSFGVSDPAKALGELPAIFQPQSLIDMWSGQFGAEGMRAVVRPADISISMMRYPNQRLAASAVVDGAVLTAKGRNVGEFRRTVQLDEHGKLIARHNRMFLDAKAQGTGFSRQFDAQSEHAYRANGISSISLHAVRVGGYAWARAGYEFVAEGATAATRLTQRATEASRQVTRALAQGRISQDEFAMLAPRLLVPGQRPNKKTISSTQHLIALGDLGKRIMVGANWEGVKLLTPTG